MTHNKNHRRTVFIDISKTIIHFTLLDAFPLPHIHDTINNVTQYRVFSTTELHNAYHHVSIKKSDRLYRVFQVGNALYQFTHMLFRVTNGMACFQQIMMNLIAKEKGKKSMIKI